MAARVLVDTNVLVYAYDPSEPAKQAVAAELLGVLHALGLAALSVQSLSELFAVTTTKLSPPMSAEEAGRQLERYAQSWPILALTPAIVLEATRAVRDHRMPYWDALIWAVARLNQLAIIFTEDFQHGRVIEGVRYVNPFRPDFSLDQVRALAG